MIRTHHIRPLVLALATLTCTRAPAATVWINDWDSPQEQLDWSANVTVVEAGSEDYVASRDLDGNGSYGSVGVFSGRSVWART